MEKVVDNDFSILHENRIIADNCIVELNNSSIEFGGKGNIVYFSGGGELLELEKCRIQCKGNNNLIFIHTSKFPLKLVITLGHGSCIGLGSICSGAKTQGVNSIYTGRPAKLMREGITWRHKGTNQVLESEIENKTYEVLKDDKFIYKNEEMQQLVEKYREELGKQKEIQNRLEFFLRYEKE